MVGLDDEKQWTNVNQYKKIEGKTDDRHVDNDDVCLDDTTE